MKKYVLRSKTSKFHVDCFSQTEPVTVPSCLKISFMWVRHSRDLEVGVCYTATQWALTFPNLHRHHVLYRVHKTLLCFLYNTLPVASFLCIRFLCVMCSFSTANNQSTSIKRSTTERRSTCYVCSYTDAFSTAVFTNWPANLMCWIVLPLWSVLAKPCAIYRNRQL